MRGITMVPGGAFLAPRMGLLPSVTEGLKLWVEAGTSLAETYTNRASAVLDGLAGLTAGSGTPTLGGNELSFAAGQYLNTGVAETEAMTLVLVARTSAALDATATRPAFFGNYGFPSGGIGLTITLTPGLPAASLGLYCSYLQNGSVVSTVVSRVIPDVTKLNLIVAVVEPGVGRRLYNFTENDEPSVFPAVLPRSLLARTLRVGGTYPSGNSGPNSIHVAHAFQRALSHEEIVRRLVPQVRARGLQRYGLTF